MIQTKIFSTDPAWYNVGFCDHKTRKSSLSMSLDGMMIITCDESSRTNYITA